MWYPPCHRWYRRVDLRIHYGDKECLLRTKIPPRSFTTCLPSQRGISYKIQYIRINLKLQYSLMLWECSDNRRVFCPIHENVVLCSSGDIWLAGKRRAAIGWGGDIFCVDSELGPVTPDALLSSPAMFAAPRTRSLAPLGCTLSSHYFCYSNSSINYALE